MQYRDPVLGVVFLAYAWRIDVSYPSERVQTEYSGPIDVNKVADDVVASIHADPEFAAQVAQQLQGNAASSAGQIGEM